MELSIGLVGTRKDIVSEKNTAKTLGSGTLHVFATPALIALMEGAAMNAIQSSLPEGSGTVGTAIDIQHVSASPLGMNITATAELIEINGKRLLFKVEASDEKGLIGVGKHERYMIQEEKFITRANEKLSK